MTRDFVINGECLVRVKGPADTTISTVKELGLAQEGIRIEPYFVHKDVNVDDFGPEIPAEVQYLLAHVIIRMNLIHYDNDILTECINQSMGGASSEGLLVSAGTMMGRGQPLYNAKCHYVSVGLTSPVLGKPWRFYNCYLMSPGPVAIPISTERTLVSLNWRAIPYTPITSSGVIQSNNIVLWDRVDTDLTHST